MVQADTAGGMREHLAWSGAGFKLLVCEEDAIEVRDMLAPPSQRGECSGADCEIDHDNSPTRRRFT
jgi:hypothetical protein